MGQHHDKGLPFRGGGGGCWVDIKKKKGGTRGKGTAENPQQSEEGECVQERMYVLAVSHTVGPVLGQDARWSIGLRYTGVLPCGLAVHGSPVVSASCSRVVQYTVCGRHE